MARDSRRLVHKLLVDDETRKMTGSLADRMQRTLGGTVNGAEQPLPIAGAFAKKPFIGCGINNVEIVKQRVELIRQCFGWPLRVIASEARPFRSRSG